MEIDSRDPSRRERIRNASPRHGEGSGVAITLLGRLTPVSWRRPSWRFLAGGRWAVLCHQVAGHAEASVVVVTGAATVVGRCVRWPASTGSPNPEAAEAATAGATVDVQSWPQHPEQGQR